MEDLDESHWWYRARREIVCDVVTRFVSRGCDIVDYGCGTGAMTARLRDLGYRVVGADVSEDMLEACRRRGLPTIDLGNDGLLTPEGAGCLLACDVLEHAEDDVDLLERFRGGLRSGRLLIGTVPAHEFLWSGEDYVSSHYRRYTQATLRWSLKSSGYEILWSSYFNTFLFPLAVSDIMAKRLFRPRYMYRSNVAPTPGWQNEFLRAIFSKERVLLRWLRLPFGLSLIFVARPLSVAPSEDPLDELRFERGGGRHDR